MEGYVTSTVIRQSCTLYHFICDCDFGNEVLIAFLLDAYQAHKDNFDNETLMAFGISAQQQNSSKDEIWLKRLKRVARDRINILDYNLR